MVEQIPTKEFLFVPVDANARTGRRMERYGDGRRCLELTDVMSSTVTANACWHSLETIGSLSRTRFLALARVEYPIRSTASAAATTKNGLTTS